jgi:hypothetical protein
MTFTIHGLSRADHALPAADASGSVALIEAG